MDFLLHFGPSHYNDLFRCDNPFFAASGKGDVFEFVEKYKESYEKSRADSKHMGLICIPSGNHDMDRLARHIKGDNLKLAFAFLLSMPGAPFIYYGDEIGMNYVENLVSVEGGYGRTGSRSPMQWDSSTNAGFSSAPAEKLYIPLDPSNKRPTVQAQQQNKKSLYHEIQKLIKIRQEHEALQSRGEIEFIFAKKNEYPLAYVRSSGEGEKILVIINPSEKEVSFPCDLKKLGGKTGDSTDLLKNVIYTFGGKTKFDGKKIIVAERSAVFFKLT